MARNFPWRRHLSDAVCWHQAEAMNATIFILREMGPTGFLLKEDGENRHFKVYLGDPHRCTCSVFKKEKDLCKHISWLLLKKFRVPKDNPITWQLGLVEREINEVLHGQMGQQQRRKKPVSKKVLSAADGREVMQQRDIAQDDVCPICQEELLSKHLPVTYCKFSCGNSIHIRCMKIWAEHQQGLGKEEIKCPICREDFGPLNLLKMEFRNATGEKQSPAVRMDRHLGTCCRSCHIAPIEGKCYRCSHCMDYYLCQLCFNTPMHTNHAFEFRHKRNQRWRSVERTFGVALPQAVTQDLMNRDISSTDYDLLLQLDSETAQQPSQISESLIDSLPVEMVRNTGSILAPGVQCRVCLRGYEPGQIIKKLPCNHKFHKDCIKNWLLHSHPTCPIDGLVVDIQPNRSQPRTTSEPQSTSEVESTVSQDQTMLVIPGVGVRIDTRPQVTVFEARRPSLHRRLPRNAPPVHRPPSSMEIAGVPLGDNLGMMLDTTSERSVSSNRSLPGSHLLRKADHQRDWVGQQLAILERSEVGRRVTNSESTPAEGEGYQAGDMASEGTLSDVIGLLRTPGGSAPPRMENKPPIPSRVANQNTAIQRTVSHNPRGINVSSQKHTHEQADRSNILQGLQTFQDLYLGNSPQINPPEQEISVPISRGRLRPNVFMGQRKKKPAVLPSHRTMDMALEGNQIASLTLRDILRQ
ncbi:E3 ubiquitin-protein ligase Zswim2-like [Gigantopelta aegis]|uniref:E3 ubiquitin-protein ligase Zswim2-like n=1 Tax=Gigantopelta aegis TaxID=1735272 RepID=UPI001B8880CB|nr:E3 ubiquitin-protein ligase Zswim2-like [Gigantopelta aegis]